MLVVDVMSAIVGFRPAERLLDLADNEMLLQLSGDAPVLARLPSYLNDPAFAGMFDANPFHDPSRPVMRQAPALDRVVVRRPPPNGADTLSPSELLKALKQAPPATDEDTAPSGPD